MSASLTLGLRTIKRIGEQIISKEVVIGVRARFSPCIRPTTPQGKGSGKASVPLTPEPGSEVVDPSEEKKPTNSNS